MSTSENHFKREIRESLEKRAREYYDDDYTVKMTEWSDDEWEIKVYHRFYHADEKRTWLHVWVYYSGYDEAWESFEYHKGDAAINETRQKVAGGSEITFDVLESSFSGEGDE